MRAPPRASKPVLQPRPWWLALIPLLTGPHADKLTALELRMLKHAHGDFLLGWAPRERDVAEITAIVARVLPERVL